MNKGGLSVYFWQKTQELLAFFVFVAYFCKKGRNEIEH